MAASTPEAQMREVLSDFSPDWSKVVALASSHGSAVTDVRAGPDEDTALHSAAYWGAVEAIGASPLHLCALNGQCDAARILVEQRDADLTAEDEAGMQPLHTACSVGDVRIAECLVSLGADATAGVKGNGNTACHVAAREGHPAVVRMLLEKCGCDRVLTALNDAHEQPLHRAAAHGQKEIVSCLVKAGADVAAKDSNGDTSLHLAAMFGMSETAAELVALGASVGAVDEDGQTPLHLAAMAKQPDTARVLINLGADCRAENEEGESPRDICLQNNLGQVLDATAGRA